MAGASVLFAARMRELVEGRLVVGRVVLGGAGDDRDWHLLAILVDGEEDAILEPVFHAEPAIVIHLPFDARPVFERLVSHVVPVLRGLFRDFEDGDLLPDPLGHVPVVQERGGGDFWVALRERPLDLACELFPHRHLRYDEEREGDRDENDQRDHLPLGFLHVSPFCAQREKIGEG